MTNLNGAARPDLPGVFLERLAQLLGDEFPAFLASYAQPARQGLRLNTLRLAPAFQASLSGWERVAWCPSGYLAPDGVEADLARHPYHTAGVYYLQEPSAMAPAEILAPRPGELVLDLCAAPGGKSSAIAGLMHNQGLLVANDTHPRRVRGLAMNLERCGVTCSVVLNETPQRLAGRWAGLFDRVLVDAPCSGQGMFRKSKPARAEWQPGRVKTDAARQASILDAAAHLVRPGGALVYSTCTFEPEENEANIAQFLQRRPDFSLVSIDPAPGFSPGRPEWTDDHNPAIRNSIRIWPHLSLGEGHFVAKLQRQISVLPNTEQFDAALSSRAAARESMNTPAGELWHEFCDQYLQHTSPLYQAITAAPATWLIQAGQDLYLRPPGAPDLSGLRVVRWGWWVGTLKGQAARHSQVFTPGHALAMALTPADVQHSLDLKPEDARLAAYLRGESLRAPGEPGWVLVSVDGFPLGWGKRSGDQLKNRRPPGLAQAIWE